MRATFKTWKEHEKLGVDRNFFLYSAEQSFCSVS